MGPTTEANRTRQCHLPIPPHLTLRYSRRSPSPSLSELRRSRVQSIPESTAMPAVKGRAHRRACAMADKLLPHETRVQRECVAVANLRRVCPRREWWSL